MGTTSSSLSKAPPAKEKKSGPPSTFATSALPSVTAHENKVTTADEDIWINLKTATGETIRINVKITDTIQTGKLRVEKEKGIPIEEQRFIFDLKSLQNHQTFAECGLVNGSSLHFVQVQGAGHNRFLSQPNQTSVTASASESIENSTALNKLP